MEWGHAAVGTESLQKKIIHTQEDVANRYGLKVYLWVLRIGFPFEVFMQIYANIKKDKVNMTLSLRVLKF